MSRIGKRKLNIPEGVMVSVAGNTVSVKGLKGELSMQKRLEIDVVVKDQEVSTIVKKETKETPALWGTTNALIQSMIKGVTEGYEKKLELVGVGYRATATDDGLSLTLGYSHPVVYTAPEGIKIQVLDNKNITISGIDKQLVGQVAAEIRAFRKPEPYKGKGIKYSNEYVRRKAGKAGKV